jgi:hypothetical protein
MVLHIDCKKIQYVVDLRVHLKNDQYHVYENKNLQRKLFYEIIRTQFHVQKSCHLCTNAYDPNDRVIDHMFLQEKQHRQYRVHLEVHVYKHVFLKLLEYQNGVYVLYQSYNQDIDHRP